MNPQEVRDTYRMGYEDGAVHIMRLLEGQILTVPEIIDYIRSKYL